MSTKIKLKKKSNKLHGKRLLAWCDSPRVATGFGIVAKEVLTRLAKHGMLIDVIGINDTGGWYNLNTYPFRIYPACPGASRLVDMYGRPVLKAALVGEHNSLVGPWDFIWVLGDHFILEQKGDGAFSKGTSWFLRRVVDEWNKRTKINTKLILYTPVDSPLKENWVTNGLLPFDVIVSYTEYGKREMFKACPPEYQAELNKKLRIIPHGVDLNAFKPLRREEVLAFKKSVFGRNNWLREQDFFIVNVSRNQPRKDLARTLEVFRRFQQRVSDSRLYLHCASQDAGGNLLEVARYIGLDIKTIAFSNNWSAHSPAPVEFLNRLYNAADCVISTHMGEGWGLPLTEAMAAARPVVFHNVTSIPEILGIPEQDFSASKEDNTLPLPPKDGWRGLGVRTSDFVCLGAADLERVRPIACVDDFVEKLLWVYENEETASKMGLRARQYLKNGFSWDDVGAKWAALFEQLVN